MSGIHAKGPTVHLALCGRGSCTADVTHQCNTADVPPLAITGMFSGMRAKGPKADLALVVADKPAAAAGVFTTNVMAAAPVTYCQEVLAGGSTARAVRFPSF